MKKIFLILLFGVFLLSLVSADEWGYKAHYPREFSGPMSIFSNGSNFFTLGIISDSYSVVFTYYLNWTYTGKNNTLQNDTGFPTSFYWNGTRWYVVRESDDKIDVYYQNWTREMSIAISTGTEDYGLYFNGTYWFIVESQNSSVELYYPNFTSTQLHWNLSSVINESGGQATDPRGIWRLNTSYNNLGDVYWISRAGQNNPKRVYAFYPNGTYTGKNVNLKSQTGEELGTNSLQGIYNNGTYWYVGSLSEGLIIQYYNSCRYNGTGDWVLDTGSECIIDQNTDIGTNSLKFTGLSGLVTVNAIIQAGKVILEQGARILINQGKQLIAKQT